MFSSDNKLLILYDQTALHSSTQKGQRELFLCVYVLLLRTWDSRSDHFSLFDAIYFFGVQSDSDVVRIGLTFYSVVLLLCREVEVSSVVVVAAAIGGTGGGGYY